MRVASSSGTLSKASARSMAERLEGVKTRRPPLGDDEPHDGVGQEGARTRSQPCIPPNHRLLAYHAPAVRATRAATTHHAMVPALLHQSFPNSLHARLRTRGGTQLVEDMADMLVSREDIHA